jgi:hypothetical protein
MKHEHRALVSALGILCLGASSLAAAADPQPDSPRIVELRAAIARDKARLEALLIAPLPEEGDPVVIDPELREIAERLPQLQQELRILERNAESTPRQSTGGPADSDTAGDGEVSRMDEAAPLSPEHQANPSASEMP